MKTDDERTVFAVIGVIAIYLITLCLGPVAKGWALAILWGWFIVPTFAISQLSIAVAIGISLIVNFLWPGRSGGGDKDKSVGEMVFESLAKAFLEPLIVVGLGAIVVQWA